MPERVMEMLPAIVFGIVILIIIAKQVRIVPPAQAWVMVRLGNPLKVWGSGIHVKIPIIDSVYRRVDMKEQLCDFPPQSVITKDNVSVNVDTYVFYQVTDPESFAFGVNDPYAALEALCATTLRNVIGELELDETLTSRDNINNRMQAYVDNATDPWGIKVNRVELKSIDPPRDVQDAMAKQMEAERGKRAQILRAQGLKEAAILEAQGEKESAELRAAAHKIELTLKAGGEAAAIRLVDQATSDGIKMLKAAGVDEAVLKMKGLETLQKMAAGRATTIYIPTELQNLVGLMSLLKESVGPDTTEGETAEEIAEKLNMEVDEILSQTSKTPESMPVKTIPQRPVPQRPEKSETPRSAPQRFVPQKPASSKPTESRLAGQDQRLKGKSKSKTDRSKSDPNFSLDLDIDEV